MLVKLFISILVSVSAYAENQYDITYKGTSMVNGVAQETEVRFNYNLNDDGSCDPSFFQGFWRRNGRTLVTTFDRPTLIEGPVRGLLYRTRYAGTTGYMKWFGEPCNWTSVDYNNAPTAGRDGLFLTGIVYFSRNNGVEAMHRHRLIIKEDGSPYLYVTGILPRIDN